jgi:hypothetical protein
MKKKQVAVIGAIALLGGAIQAHAGTLVLTGNTVIFTLDDTQLGLLGEPLLYEDTLYFLPTTFVAEALNDAGIRTTGQTNKILVTAKGGRTLSTMNLEERGDYRRIEEFGGGPTAVSVTGQLRALDTSNLSNEVDDRIESTTSFPPTEFSGPPEDWIATASVDLVDWDSIAVNVTITNILSAVSLNLGDLAYIEKEYVGLTVTTVPLPNAIFLFGFALSSLLLTLNTERR